MKVSEHSLFRCFFVGGIALRHFSEELKYLLFFFSFSLDSQSKGSLQFLCAICALHTTFLSLFLLFLSY